MIKRNNFKSVYPMANSLYGVNMDETSFEDLALTGWNLIGNRQTKLYRYKTNTLNGRIQLPCNVDLIEAVYADIPDANTSSPVSATGNISNQFIEGYNEGFKNIKHSLYDSNKLVHYRLEGDELVFTKDYNNVVILYHGIIVDNDGLPYLNDKEVQALALYCAYAQLYKQSLVMKDGNTFQLANALKADWLRACNAARVRPMTHNEIDDVLDVRTRWDRKFYGKSFKPVL